MRAEGDAAALDVAVGAGTAVGGGAALRAARAPFGWTIVGVVEGAEGGAMAAADDLGFSSGAAASIVGSSAGTGTSRSIDAAIALRLGATPAPLARGASTPVAVVRDTATNPMAAAAATAAREPTTRRLRAPEPVRAAPPTMSGLGDDGSVTD